MITCKLIGNINRSKFHRFYKPVHDYQDRLLSMGYQFSWYNGDVDLIIPGVREDVVGIGNDKPSIIFDFLSSAGEYLKTDSDVPYLKSHIFSLSNLPVCWNHALSCDSHFYSDGIVTNKTYDINYMFSQYPKNLSSANLFYLHHRVKCYRKLQEIQNKHRLKVAPTGSYNDYFDIMQKTKICVSPLGIGELCWRDFEAILSNCILVKPRIDVDTYPPIKGRYIPVQYDFSDLEETIKQILDSYSYYFYRFMEIKHQLLSEYRDFPYRFDKLMRNYLLVK